MEEQSASLTDTALHNEKVIRQEIVDCKALLSDNKKKMSHEAEKEIKLTEELSAVAEKSDILLQQKEQLETEVKRRREDNHQQRECEWGKSNLNMGILSFFLMKNYHWVLGCGGSSFILKSSKRSWKNAPLDRKTGYL